MSSEVQKSHKLYKKALLFEYLTIVWNLFEGVSCVALGIISGSISLSAYGLESSVEVFASSVVVWDLKGAKKDREDIALKLIGAAYLVVSLYIFIDAVKTILEGHRPEKTTIGIIFMIATVIVMLILGLAKKDIGKKIQSTTVLADAKFTLIDGALASAVLIGLLFNAVFGWWWMDAALALFLSGVAFREGIREVLQ
jgi:divalent metal cation (Fe/Co/Zn/Cd) transporter